MARFVKIILLIIGALAVGLGFIGIWLPLLPTTPFLLLAAACYAKSSEKFYNWLLNNKWFGQYIRNWREGKGIPWRTKLFAIAMLVLAIGYSTIFVIPHIIGKGFMILIACGVSLHIISQPTLQDS